MAFDSGMVRALTKEIAKVCAGARIEKINQPEKDEVVLTLHTFEGAKRLSLSASANNPRLYIQSQAKENPAVPPLFCTLLRKQLGGAKIVSVEQCGFERAVKIELDSRDEMGFSMRKRLYIEIMGRYSNIILTNGEDKIIGILKPVDFTTSAKRQMLVGMIYEAPPSQNKRNPLEENELDFITLASENPNAPTDKFIQSNYMGISSLVAREIAYRSHQTVGDGPHKIRDEFFKLVDIIKEEKFTPVTIYEGDKAIEYCFCEILQYESLAKPEIEESFSALIEKYYKSRDNSDRTHQRAADLFKLIGNVKNKLIKKTALQKAELEDCAKKEEYKRLGDLITSNMYMLKKGMSEAQVVDYYSEDQREVKIALNPRLTPSQNAQIHYKKYNKLKTAEGVLTEQISISEKEIAYLESVEYSLSRAVGDSEIDEIRAELSRAGYGARIKKSSSKIQKVKPKYYESPNGYKLICGRNNIQNDEITFSAAKTDWWFHVKGAPGAHVVMICEGEEPPAEDFTFAAQIAAYNSSLASSPLAAVDYTQIKYIKKPGGSKPGFVTYSTYWSAYVKPSESASEK